MISAKKLAPETDSTELSASSGEIANSSLNIRKEPAAIAFLIPFFNNSRGIRWELGTFIIFVVIPAFLSIVYFSFIASPQYAVETRFVVRSGENRGAALTMGATGQIGNSTFSLTTQPAYIVAQYIRSRAIVEDLEKDIDLRKMFSRSDADPLSRLKIDASVEDLTKYWRDMTRAYVDAPSGIVSVEVKAFTAEDAYAISEAVVKFSEELVNNISRRARQDILQAAEDEVHSAQEQLRSVLASLQGVRNSEGMLDPMKAAEESVKLLGQLRAEQLRLESELAVTSRALREDSPTIRQLKARIDILEGQIAKLRTSLASNATSTTNMAASLRRFEELETRRLLGEKLLAIAEEGLKGARSRAERQMLYFMVFVPPTIPKKALFPPRLAYSLIFPLGFLVAWAIGALLWKTIEDHRE